MARRAVAGQLNMFDFFSAEENSLGEVEMVSLMPNVEDDAVLEKKPIEVEEAEVVEEMPVKKKTPAKTVQKRKEDGKVAMSRCYEINGEKLEIAYLNYNKIRIVRGESEPEIHIFDSSKEAVDYYVNQMQEFECDEE